MTKTEYNTWVTNTYLAVDSCKNLGTINVVFNHDMSFVMIIDLITMRTVNQKIKDNDTREAVAIAFTKLRGGKIPEIANIPEYERVPYNTNYYVVHIDNDKMSVNICVDEDDFYDKSYFEMNNYFHTKERAQEILNKIKMLLRLERLHDMFCPNYKPQNRDWKYSVYYDSNEEEWKVTGGRDLDSKFFTYFPTLEIAQQAADILNKEKK